MAQPYIGEIRLFAGNFAPNGWYFCDGSLYAIAGDDVLFNLIGTTYGGDGQSTFAVPDLRGRVPIHMGSGFTLGQRSGAEQVTLTVSQIPIHSHVLTATSNTATQNAPTGQLLSATTGATVDPYGSLTPTTTLDPTSLANVGGSQPHTNFQPYLCLSFIISRFGIFPSQT
ncbi:MAG TPA: tail fiber protein [Chloroflexota bacterium]|jgi:microcystin-dependent protein